MENINENIIKFVKYLIDNEYIESNNSRSINKCISHNLVNIIFKLSETEKLNITEVSKITNFFPLLSFNYLYNNNEVIHYTISYDVYDKLVDIIKTKSKLESLKKELEQDYEDIDNVFDLLYKISR